MSSERLEPLETLETDYYLNEQNIWYSDDEQRDGESSDDELREEISKLAGVQCRSRKRRELKRATKKKDEFESDMDDELNESFVAHASKMFSSSSKQKATAEEDKIMSTDDEIPALVGDTDDEAQSSVAATETTVKQDLTSSLKRNDSANKSKKSVTFESDKNNLDNEKKHMESKRSSFDDEDNLLRKAVDKATKATKKESVEFYDSDEDEDNERWVRQHRERLKIVRPRSNSSKKSYMNEDVKNKEHDDDSDDNGKTDAVLSCPACMSLLTRDCQRHDLYHDQYRAIFVENCNVVKSEVLFLPQSGKNKRKSQSLTAGVKPNTIIDSSSVGAIPKEDLFHPVRCSVCSTNVAVYDCDELFHRSSSSVKLTNQAAMHSALSDDQPSCDGVEFVS